MFRVSGFVSAGQLTAALVTVAAVTAVVWPRDRVDVTAATATTTAVAISVAAQEPPTASLVTEAVSVVTEAVTTKKSDVSSSVLSTSGATTVIDVVPPTEIARTLRADVRIVLREPRSSPPAIALSVKAREPVETNAPAVVMVSTGGSNVAEPRDASQQYQPAGSSVGLTVRPKTLVREARKAAKQRQTGSDCIPFLWPGDQPERWKTVCGSSRRKASKS